ncbi:NAD(P)H-dependent glycerol-3-phosphate dehydrogenase [Arundinibacter roseus]|uniref:Glycerol-3-phosphate dehydrogenase [NAD(P)+] n=1 Tax=Arundinibacter roseus TaxID=2070510 RepID=A0A4R4KLW9_9BACT|nr:NAD(P)H-dependent glycerol-3-phosphate dehydrogenase [Arundinibacter roseus]TDB67986.1 NAD(P)H-dependent glycerol-3-phosphate dehydrogenase [Arundinibacter roseus]
MNQTLTEKIAVIGGGSWATALVKILCEQPHIQVRWWLRSAEDIAHIRTYHHNPSYLSDVYLSPKKVKVCDKIKEAIKGAQYVVLAIPAAFIEEPLRELSPELLKGKRIVSAIKGMVPHKNKLVTDWIEETYGIPLDDMCVIAGPCHAEEVALEKQSYLTIASTNLACSEDFSKLMTCRYVTANPLTDLYGVEYAAVMKNIVALACGITHGIGYGDNFQAVMVANAMQEIRRFVTAVDPRERDLSSSAYLGDLLVTAYSQFSRNRLFGNMIGRGYSVKAAQLEMKMIAEGYYAAKSIFTMNEKYQVSMPITEAVYRILYEGAAPAFVMEQLKKHLK